MMTVRERWHEMSLLERTALCLSYGPVVPTGYGIYRFPAGPIRAVGGGDVDKLGGLHSRDEFELLRIWERTCLEVRLAGLVAAVLAGAERHGAEMGGATWGAISGATPETPSPSTRRSRAPTARDTRRRRRCGASAGA